MSNKFSFFQIVKDHINTLYIYRPNKEKTIDVFSIFINLILPFIISGLLISFKIILNASDFFLVEVAFLIFTIILFISVFTIYKILEKEREKDIDKQNNLKINLIKETFYNIQFAVLIAFITMITLLLIVFISNEYLNLLLSFVAYYFIFVFVFTFLIIMKRSHALILNEF